MAVYRHPRDGKQGFIQQIEIRPRLPYYFRVESFSAMLRGGDRRSIGRSVAVVTAVRRAPGRFDELWHHLAADDAIVRMRAADAAEKLSRDNPSLLAPHKKTLLARTLDDGTAEMRWHLIAMMARLSLNAGEIEELTAYLQNCLREDPSRIVMVAALQAAADLSSRHPQMKTEFYKMLELARDSSAPSLRARARKLSGTS